jgi:hypothetical protein
MQTKFYGEITIVFKDGKPTNMRELKNTKLD